MRPTRLAILAFATFCLCSATRPLAAQTLSGNWKINIPTPPLASVPPTWALVDAGSSFTGTTAFPIQTPVSATGNLAGSQLFGRLYQADATFQAKLDLPIPGVTLPNLPTAKALILVDPAGNRMNGFVIQYLGVTPIGFSALTGTRVP
jgi:hypothetical protein